MTLRKLRRLSAASEGVAVVEFAIALPFLLLMFLGAAEVVNYVLANMTVSRIGMTVADNAGRVMTKIDETDIVETFAGANELGRNLDFANNGRIVLSSLVANGQTQANKKGQAINWQRCWGELDVNPAYGREGTGKGNNSLKDGMGPAGSKIMAAPGTAVMFVEISYEYEPIIYGSVIGNRMIRYETAFNVRGRIDQDITNTSSLPVNRC
jgi:hypothetical protein